MSMPLGVAVFGAGAFGRNHLRVYRELRESGSPVELTAIVDTDGRAAEGLRDAWQVPVFASAEACLAARQAGQVYFAAASVCVPTSAHYTVASQCLAQNVDVLVEKPIASTLEQADALVREARQAQRILQVGQVERFNPAVTAVLPLLHGPMFFEAHRLSVFTPRALDVDVVLDLMIHDLDVVLSFARSPLRQVHAVGLPILSPKVDIANVRLEFESGAVANFTASRVSTERVRKLRFFQPHQYVSIDYARQDLLIINVAGNGVASAPGVQAGLSFEKPPVRQSEPLRLEIEAFLESVRTRTPPKVTAEQGREALALALEINREMEAHAKRAGLERFSGGV
jgi:predicted dehydrogenase